YGGGSSGKDGSGGVEVLGIRRLVRRVRNLAAFGLELGDQLGIDHESRNDRHDELVARASGYVPQRQPLLRRLACFGQLAGAPLRYGANGIGVRLQALVELGDLVVGQFRDDLLVALLRVAAGQDAERVDRLQIVRRDRSVEAVLNLTVLEAARAER